MQDSQNISDLIEQYLSGRMNENELNSFQSFISSNESAKQQFETELAVKNAILENQLSRFRQNMTSYRQKQKNIRISAIVASCLLIIATTVFITLNDAEESGLIQTHNTTKPKESKKITDLVVLDNTVKNDSLSNLPQQTYSAISTEKLEKKELQSDYNSIVAEEANSFEIQKIVTSNLKYHQPDLISNGKPVADSAVINSLKCKKPYDLIITSVPSTEDANDGSIEIKTNRTDLAYSIDNQEDFVFLSQFDYLVAGEYFIEVKDSAGCIFTYKKEVEETACKKDNIVLYPNDNAVIELETSIKKSGYLYILESSMKKVYETSFEAGANIQIDINSFDLNTEYLKCIVEYSDETCISNITIIK